MCTNACPIAQPTTFTEMLFVQNILVLRVDESLFFGNIEQLRELFARAGMIDTWHPGHFDILTPSLHLSVCVPFRTPWFGYGYAV
jgi:hypothetical protein